MMARFILRRTAVAVVQLVVLGIAVFFAISMLPADPVSRFVGLNASPEAYAAAKGHLGLDKSMLDQLAGYLGLEPSLGSGLLQGSFGVSWVSGTPVTREIAGYLPVTLELVTISFIVAIVFGFALGIWGASKPGGMADKITLYYGLFAGSQPEFCWGLLFVFVFFEKLGIAPGPIGRLSPLTTPPVPVTGFMTIDTLLRGQPALFMQALHYLLLPVATLAFVLSGPIIKMVRENLSRSLRSDFVLFAVASGLKRKSVLGIALRSAIAPSMTLIGVLYAYMIGGAVLVESIFALGGLGQYAIRSILAFDYPAIQGVVLTISALSLAVYLSIDLLHAAIDPRVA